MNTYIYICKAVFYFAFMGLNMTCQGIWVAQDCAIRFAERGVIGSQHPGDFLLASFFLLELKKMV